MMAPSGSRSFRQGCQRVLYWIPVLFIALIVAWSYYAYVLQLCIESIEDTGEKIIYLLVYHIIFLMFVWAYWQTIFTKPMSPSKEFYLAYPDKELLEREDRGESQQEILRRLAKKLPIYTRTNSGAIRFCDHCQLLKPDRCHHCSVCDKYGTAHASSHLYTTHICFPRKLLTLMCCRCILKMDHHCPWVNNCVGFSNYKFFILFLAYSLLYCLFITATDLKYFITFWTAGGQAHKRLKEYLNGLPDTQAKFHMMFLFFAAAMFSVSLASLLAYHCWLVCKNRSTLEAVRAPAFRHGIDKNGFSLGFMKNIRQVFGDEMRYWPLPLFSSLGDGCAYPTCLVNQDPEQPSSPTGHNIASKSVAEGHHFPSKPLRESQSRLMTSAPSWTEGDPAGDKDEAGTNNPGMTIENEA